MAQLNATTINGGLSVTGETRIDGKITTTGYIYLDNDKALCGASTGGSNQNIAKIEDHDRLLLGGSGNSDVVIRTGGKIIHEATADFTNGIIMPVDGTIRFNDSCGNYSNDSSGSGSSGGGLGMYINSSGNLHVGAYSTGMGTHTGNTWINSLGGNVNLQCTSGSISLNAVGGDTIKTSLRPYESSQSANTSLGSSNYKWYRLYATQACSTSDRRAKYDITAIADYPAMYSRRGNAGNTFEQFFDRLTPVTFGLNEEKDDRMHIGFVAQDIEDVANEVGLPVENLGLLVHEYETIVETGEEKDAYCLSYEEFVALNTYMIQKQKARIDELEAKNAELEDRLAAIEEKLNNT